MLLIPTFEKLIKFHYDGNIQSRNDLYYSLDLNERHLFINYLLDNEVPIEGAFYELNELNEFSNN